MESFVIFSIIVILISIAMVKKSDYQKSSKVNPNKPMLLAVASISLGVNPTWLFRYAYSSDVDPIGLK